MRLQPTENGFLIEANDLAPLLGVEPAEVARLMREGLITSLSETGQGADAGRFRVSFRYGTTRIRFTTDANGDVLRRSRTTVAPQLGAAPGFEG
ncbi:MAG: hypothetical protein H6901_03470 [Rhodobacteraceae bacterium]|nr:hypothetical protein [Paracoccaceae bacterium]MCP5341252.1 hypothetical protein [Paracoccaceae bacterium]